MRRASSRDGLDDLIARAAALDLLFEMDVAGFIQAQAEFFALAHAVELFAQRAVAPVVEIQAANAIAPVRPGVRVGPRDGAQVEMIAVVRRRDFM